MPKHSAGITNGHDNVEGVYGCVGRCGKVKEEECYANTINVKFVRRLERVQLARQLELKEINIEIRMDINL